jgi:hypothetical protein
MLRRLITLTWSSGFAPAEAFAPPAVEGAASSKSEGSASASASSVVVSFLFGRLRRCLEDWEEGEDLVILDRSVACFMRRLSDLLVGKRLALEEGGNVVGLRPARSLGWFPLRMDLVGCDVRCAGRVGAIFVRRLLFCEICGRWSKLKLNDVEVGSVCDSKNLRLI